MTVGKKKKKGEKEMCRCIKTTFTQCFVRYDLIDVIPRCGDDIHLQHNQGCELSKCNRNPSDATPMTREMQTNLKLETIDTIQQG